MRVIRMKKLCTDFNLREQSDHNENLTKNLNETKSVSNKKITMLLIMPKYIIMPIN